MHQHALSYNGVLPLSNLLDQQRQQLPARKEAAWLLP
jgi:hypothetical protein